MGWWSKGAGLLRFARDLRGLLRQRIDDAAAAGTIARGAAEREQRFLDMLDAKVWPSHVVARHDIRRAVDRYEAVLRDVVRPPS